MKTTKSLSELKEGEMFTSDKVKYRLFKKLHICEYPETRHYPKETVIVAITIFGIYYFNQEEIVTIPDNLEQESDYCILKKETLESLNIQEF